MTANPTSSEYDKYRKKKREQSLSYYEPKLPPKRVVPQFEKDLDTAFKELRDLLLKKHEDYGPKNISESPGGPLNGLRVRMHDKLARINNLIDKSRTPKNESLEDSFVDMANYAVIGLLVLRKQWDNESNDTLLNEAKKIWSKSE